MVKGREVAVREMERSSEMKGEGRRRMEGGEDAF